MCANDCLVSPHMVFSERTWIHGADVLLASLYLAVARSVFTDSLEMVDMVRNSGFPGHVDQHHDGIHSCLTRRCVHLVIAEAKNRVPLETSRRISAVR